MADMELYQWSVLASACVFSGDQIRPKSCWPSVNGPLQSPAGSAGDPEDKTGSDDLLSELSLDTSDKGGTPPLCDQNPMRMNLVTRNLLACRSDAARAHGTHYQFEDASPHGQLKPANMRVLAAVVT